MKTPLLIGLGLGAVGLVLLATRKASAAIPVSDAATPLARVAQSVNAHELATTASPLVVPNDAFAGQTVRVLQKGITGSEPAKVREWWKIVAPGGAVGFASAVDPAGTKNLVLLQT